MNDTKRIPFPCLLLGREKTFLLFESLLMNDSECKAFSFTPTSEEIVLEELLLLMLLFKTEKFSLLRKKHLNHT